MTKRFYVLFTILLSLNVCIPHVMYAQDDDFVSVCDRTPEVRDAILRALPDRDDCDDVTAADLASITYLNLRTPSFEADITTLNATDFNDLTALGLLRLSSNALSSLPEGIFDELTELRWLELENNALSSLRADTFDEPHQTDISQPTSDNELSRFTGGHL